MRPWLLGLALGLISLALPSLPLFSCLVHVGLAVVGGLLMFARRLLVVSGLVLGFAWGAYINASVLEARLPPCVAATDRQLVVEVLGAPEPISNPLEKTASIRFRALVVLDETAPRVPQIRPSDCGVIAGSRLRLAWYRSPSVQQGERWNVNVRVKPPWGVSEPGWI